MKSIYKTLEIQENDILANYALKNSESLGREKKEIKDLYRLEFARDRDRIIHTKAFRRLKGKTQVFVSDYGDHYRSRLTHSLEVAQIARTLARVLKANEDVVEAVSLAHDLGHTPFGHAGQDMLNKKMKSFGESFEHNVQSRRIVEVLEPQNLSKEILQCLCKHPNKKDKILYDLYPQNFLEGQIVDIADFIAYTAHDLQDGIASELLDKKDKFLESLPKNILDKMVCDVIEESCRNLKKISSVQEVREQKNKIICFSQNLKPLTEQIQKYLFTHLYYNPVVLEQTKKGEKIISDIFDFLLENEKYIPLHFDISEPVHMRIKDFIAGMTDNFAENFLESCN